jgi:hypothetical protein
LEEEVFDILNPKLRRWSYNKSFTPKMSILRVIKIKTPELLRKHHSMPIKASIIKCIDGKMVRKRKLSQENLKVASKSKIKFNSIIEIWDNHYTPPKKNYDKTKKP